MGIVTKEYTFKELMSGIDSFDWSEESVAALAENINNSSLSELVTATTGVYNSNNAVWLMFNDISCGIRLDVKNVAAYKSSSTNDCSNFKSNTANWFDTEKGDGIITASTEDGRAATVGVKLNGVYNYLASREVTDGGIVGIAWYSSDGSSYLTDGATSAKLMYSKLADNSVALLTPMLYKGCLTSRLRLVQGYCVTSGYRYKIGDGECVNLYIGSSYAPVAITD